MLGTYKIYKNGKLVECKNLITDSGNLGLLRVIAGQRKGWAAAIVGGIGNTAATTSDKQLEYPVTLGDISTTILDPVNNKIYFKASLPVQDECVIYELGCYASNITSTQTSESGGGIPLVTFTTDLLWIDVDGTSTADTTNNRVGKDSIQYVIGVSGTAKGYSSFVNDLSSLTLDTKFKLAYYTTGITDFILRFKVDDTNYYESDTWAVTNGYHIDVVEKSAFTATGTPAWSDIAFVEIEATAGGSGGSVSIDALRYDLTITDEGPLLSRVVLVTPTEKLPGVGLDLEYVLEI